MNLASAEVAQLGYWLISPDMNAIELLQQQHQHVRKLFSRLEKARSSIEKDRICQQLADNLIAHMAIEEQIFYPAAMGSAMSESQLREALAEHQEAKDLLVEVLDMDMSLAKSFEQKMSLLQEKVEHHVKEEEDEIFKHAREVMDEDELEQLGAQMKELFIEQMSAEPTSGLTEAEPERPRA